VKLVVYPMTKGFGSLAADYDLAKVVMRLINSATGPGCAIEMENTAEPTPRAPPGDPASCMSAWRLLTW
jgi:hypothetical protein